MAITNFTNLQTAVASWLNRDDLTSNIVELIQMAEDSLKNDWRLRKYQPRTFVVSADDAALPSDFKAIENLYHDGPNTFGEIEIVSGNLIGVKLGMFGTTGTPAYAAVIDKKLRFAPVPNATFNLKLTYERTLAALSASQPTNWLIDEAPAIYLYATLVESAPFLKNDSRVAVWRDLLEEKIEKLHITRERERYSGRLVARPRRALGDIVPNRTRT